MTKDEIAECMREAAVMELAELDRFEVVETSEGLALVFDVPNGPGLLTWTQRAAFRADMKRVRASESTWRRIARSVRFIPLFGVKNRVG